MPTLKKQKIIKLELVESTNTNIDHKKVRFIAGHIDMRLLQAFPGRFDNKGRFVITDGNHRLEALRLIKAEYAPVIELTHDEWVEIAINKRNIDFLVERGYETIDPPEVCQK